MSIWLLPFLLLSTTTKARGSEALNELNSLHPSLSFTCENEVDGKLPFLDVLTARKEVAERTSFSTSVYRKPTFTGQYTWSYYFSCQRYKINLIKLLVRCAMRTCTKDTLEDEIQQLRRIFNNNGYPANVVERVICVTHGPAQQLVGPKKYRVFLRLPWIGTVASTSFEKKIRRTLGSAYSACAVNVVFTTSTMFTSSLKDRIPAQQRSNVIYLCNR